MYSTGIRRSRRGDHHLIAAIDGVEGRVGDGDVGRDAGEHDGRHSGVAHQRVELGALHRRKPVLAEEQDVVAFDADLVEHFDGLGTEHQPDRRFEHAVKDAGVVVGAPHVGLVRRSRVDHPHAGSARRRNEAHDVGHHLLFALLRPSRAVPTVSRRRPFGTPATATRCARDRRAGQYREAWTGP